MDIEVGNRAVVLHNTYVCGHIDLEEGDVVTVVAAYSTGSGETHPIVSRDGTLARHHVHSSNLVSTKRRPISKMSAAEMVERYFKVEQASIVVCSDLPEYKTLNKEGRALFKALPNTPSRTYKDLNAKLRFAADFTSSDDSTCPFLTGFLETLGRDHEQLLNRIDEEDDAILEKVGSYEEYFKLRGLPMPERPSA